MGAIVEFPSNGSMDQGYLTLPVSGKGPGLVVVQEWWGLVEHIKEVCERLAAEGFVTLAPDLYHGTTTKEPDEAAKLAMALNMQEAAKDLSGAVNYLLGHDAVTGTSLGAMGFCMGGGLALMLALSRPDAIKATVSFYGIVPEPAGPPDWSKLGGPVLGHYAEHDEFAGPTAVHKMETDMKAVGKDIQTYFYPGTHHAFFNDARPEVYDAEAAKLAWGRTLVFFREQLR